MTDDFVSDWSDIMTKPDDPFYTFAKKIIETPKVVFTKTLKKSQWANTAIATGDLVDEIVKMKSEDGRNIIVYGGASLKQDWLTSFICSLILLQLEAA
jgi:dihydrofolate reductase